MRSDIMAIGGVCMACKKYSPGIYTCHACGARVCPLCVMPETKFCVICKGTRMIK